MLKVLISENILAVEYVIGFRDNRPLASIEAMQALIRTHFPSVKFQWTTSGLEKLRIANERGIVFPLALREGLESLPSLLEGIAEGPGWSVTFGLHNLDPVRELIVEPRGAGAMMDEGLAAMQRALDLQFRVHGKPPTE